MSPRPPIAPARAVTSRVDATGNPFRFACFFSVSKVLPQLLQRFLSPGVLEILLERSKSEVDDVVMMNLFGGNRVAHLEPDAVQQFDLGRRQVRRVRAQVERLLLAAREIDPQGRLRL